MEIQTASKWYRWLWLSPLLTIPTLLAIYSFFEALLYDLTCPQGWGSCAYDFQILTRWSGMIAILGSGLWHLLLLIPSRNKDSAFVRWHGRQEMILAVLRTAVPFLLFAIRTYDGALFSILLMIPIWFFGTLWGQRQAARGDCSLMRWTGRADYLPGPPVEADAGGIESLSNETLENTFRFSKDPEEREAVLKELQKRGLVENL